MERTDTVRSLERNRVGRLATGTRAHVAQGRVAQAASEEANQEQDGRGGSRNKTALTLYVGGHQEDAAEDN